MHDEDWSVRFAKLHGAGNDFLVFDGSDDLTMEGVLVGLVPRLCDRRLGIGADGVLLATPADQATLRLGYWNADGSAASFCANGTRCAARFAAERWQWREMIVATGFADIPAVVDGDSVTLELPPPAAVAPWCSLAAGVSVHRSRYLVVGVPQLVVPVQWRDFWRHDLAGLAPLLRSHPDLPSGGANVNFMQRDGSELVARSWERGIEAETLSCGSGNVACALVALAEGWQTSPVPVRTASGRILLVDVVGSPPQCPSRLTGPAEWVAEGTIAPELLDPRSKGRETLVGT